MHARTHTHTFSSCFSFIFSSHCSDIISSLTCTICLITNLFFNCLVKHLTDKEDKCVPSCSYGDVSIGMPVAMHADIVTGT